MIDFVGLLILLALVVLFGWLALRAWRSRRPLLKWLGGIVATLLTVLLAVVLVVGIFGTYQLNRNHSNPVSDVKVAMTPEQIARGEQLVNICVGCHGQQPGQLPLAGHDFLGGAAGAPPIGKLYSANLTPAHLGAWSDGEIIRAIREGVRPDGRSLIIMPSEHFRNLSDDDVQAIVAYLRTLPPVEPDNPPSRLNLVGALMIATVMGGVQTAQEPVGSVQAPPAGTSAAYGEYLINIMACRACHSANLAGGVPPGGGPPSPNLTKIVPTWTEAQFINFFRTGQEPSGDSVGERMPWQDYNRMATDDDLKAMYAYLSKLTPVETPAQ